MTKTNPALPRGVLTSDEVSAIKHALWNGKAQSLLAAEYGVTQPTISHIMRGNSWAFIPWPDGSLGPIALNKKRTLNREFIPITDETPPTLEAEEAAAAVARKLEQQEETDNAALREAITRKKRPAKRR